MTKIDWIVNHIKHETQGNFAVIRSHDYKAYQDRDISMVNIVPLSKAEKGDFSFCSAEGDEGVKAILESQASLIICPYTFNNEPPLTDMMKSAERKVLIFVEHPRLWYLRLIDMMFASADKTNYKIQTEYESRIYLEDVTVKCPTIIGTDCIIESRVVIGVPGFGYERNEIGELVLFPHHGGVRIGDYVHIGSLSCVERATMPKENTVIGDRCKIDRHCLIGHNSVLGKDVGIAGGTIIGGSVKIGDGCFLGLAVCVDSNVKIGKRCLIGNHANIRKNIPDGSVVIGDDKIIGNVDSRQDWKRLVGL